MVKLSDDILFIIFEELQDDRNKLFSLITVNKHWCKIIIPRLWKNPWKSLKKKSDKLLLKVIISHLSDETKQGHGLSMESYRKPLFDYISYCRHLNFNKIERVIKPFNVIKNEIINLFVNENRYFTHLYISYQFDYQLHLYPGVERCFSGIRYLNCSTSIKDDLSAGLTSLCKSIKVLDLFIEARDNNYGIIELIKAQKNLSTISLTTHSYNDILYCRDLEHSLIDHVNTVQCFKLTKRSSTNIISPFVNLRGLEVNGTLNDMTEWDYLEDISLPLLKFLRVSKIPFSLLERLIESTSGLLTEIRTDNISYHTPEDEKRIIHVIHQKCPKLQYLKLKVTYNNILELKILLINCHYLDGLFITGHEFSWDRLFATLTKSSPINLFKFKFSNAPRLESLKQFLDNWKGRRPISLQIGYTENVEGLLEEYKAKGVVKKYNYNASFGDGFEGFEWIQMVP